jgi:hypothetical protein
MKIIFALAFIATLALTTPVPDHELGLRYKSGDSGIRIDLYFDLLCGDCKAFHPKFE